jgi:hypothetical protein
MQSTSTLPDIEITGEIYDRTTLHRFLRHYEQLHKVTPYSLVTGYMECKETGELLYCNGCMVADSAGQWFVICHPTGTYTMRVPEHESITVTLTLNTEE